MTVAFHSIPDNEAWNDFPVPTQLSPFPYDVTLIKFIRQLGEGEHSIVFEIRVGSNPYALKLVRGLISYRKLSYDVTDNNSVQTF
jgi:hypothetical protein